MLKKIITVTAEDRHAFANDARPDLYSEQATLEALSPTPEFPYRVHQDL